MSAWTCIRVRWVNLFWDMLLLNQVLRHLRVEKLLSDEAIGTGKHRQSFRSFSASTNRDLVWEWSLERPAATSCTVSHRAAPLNASPNICSWSFSHSTSISVGRWRDCISSVGEDFPFAAFRTVLSECCNFHSIWSNPLLSSEKNRSTASKNLVLHLSFLSYQWQCLGLCIER